VIIFKYFFAHISFQESLNLFKLIYLEEEKAIFTLLLQKDLHNNPSIFLGPKNQNEKYKKK
jgi:hypothetical protein